MAKDSRIGKVLFVDIPGQNRPRYRWIISKRPNGRYTCKVPKVGVSIRDLKKKRAADFGKEALLPKGAGFRKTRRSQRGGGSTALPDKYPGLLVTAKQTTDELDDPDSVPTVMRAGRFEAQIDAEGSASPS
jgi:hypothetical protein